MRQQTKPFIVEIKQARKPKTRSEKPSIWGKLDLTIAEDQVAPANDVMDPSNAECGDRR